MEKLSLLIRFLFSWFLLSVSSISTIPTVELTWQDRKSDSRTDTTEKPHKISTTWWPGHGFSVYLSIPLLLLLLPIDWLLPWMMLIADRLSIGCLQRKIEYARHVSSDDRIMKRSLIIIIISFSRTPPVVVVLNKPFHANLLFAYGSPLLAIFLSPCFSPFPFGIRNDLKIIRVIIRVR